MPTPTTPEEYARRWAAVDAAGGMIGEAGRSIGVKAHTMQEWCRNNPRTDPALQAGMDAIRTNLVPRAMWAKEQADGTIRHSLLLAPAPTDPVDLAAAMRVAFEGMVPAAPAVAPAQVMERLLSLYPLMDVHMGMHAWGRETGGADYDLKLATSDMLHAFAKIGAITPASHTGLLIVGGDFYHADDSRNETPAHRHKLDVDGRYLKVMSAGVEVLAQVIDGLLEKHERVIVRVMRGNHDEHSHFALTMALGQRYRLEPRIVIDADPRDLFMHQWGRCAIFAHHGDKAKPQAAALYISDVCDFWSATRHRHYFTGHTHHDHAKDVGPLRWESLRAFCPPDAYAAAMGYGGRRALQSITFDQQDGLVLRALDPVERAA